MKSYGDTIRLSFHKSHLFLVVITILRTFLKWRQLIMVTEAPSASELFRRACDIYDGDRVLAEQLFNTNIPALGNRKPNELLSSPDGRRLLDDLLRKIECGEFS
jgi:hypothetical protein